MLMTKEGLTSLAEVRSLLERASDIADGMAREFNTPWRGLDNRIYNVIEMIDDFKATLTP